MSAAAMQNPFADCVNKILNSNKNRKKCILAKALKDKDIEERKAKKVCVRDETQLVDSDGNVKDVDSDGNVKDVDSDGNVKGVDSDGDVKNLDSDSDDKPQPEYSTSETIETSLKKKRTIDSDVLAKKKPEFNERERELNALATKGVIHLFNTVRQQQQTIEESLKKVGPSERKRDKVMSQFTKNKFLDKLKDNEKSESKSGGWKVLKDDFLTDAKMKDWDNDDEESSHSDDI